ncbi:Transmembrane protein SKG6 [Cordyceps militaris CM01]|uniref:Transmembrane protein SKG6 n=1 Tax=Cordyceps militaris (strain CM01) TaxID=983644 RepID=G3JST6_CORMM|nr:Transmembrane protein SKG6 [Cordyceps militaris CM01]EGX88932.1 Transmembrane protein SKG6 [Cordyceps militaris CM01]
MKPTQFMPSVAALIALVSPVLGASASITSVIPNQAHQCIRLCAWYNYQGNLPLALGCGDPYENDCYCPTATESVSKASVAIEKCVSSRCAAGDLTRDLTSLRSIYAGYCKDAGYTQDAGVLGYTVAASTSSSSSEAASPSSAATTGQKTDSQPSKTGGQDVSTTTQKTTVTQTRASGADGTGSQVVVQETETVFVDAPGSGSKPSAAVKIGVGVAVPIVVLLILAGAGLLLWRKRQAAGRKGADGAAMEERGGGQPDNGAMAKDWPVGIVREQPPTRAELAVKGGAVVQGAHEVNGSQRSESYGSHGAHEANANQRSESFGSHGVHEVNGSQQSYSPVAHEVSGSQRAGLYEVDAGSGTRLYEAPGQPGRLAAELPGSHGQPRPVGDGLLR